MDLGQNMLQALLSWIAIKVEHNQFLLEIYEL